MVDFLRFLIGLSLFAAFVETALYLAFNRWYYAHGPIQARPNHEVWTYPDIRGVCERIAELDATGIMLYHIPI